jgi:hypothetical protein
VVELVEGVGVRDKTRSDKADVDDTQNESSGWRERERAERFRLPPNSLSFLLLSERRGGKKTKGKGKVRRQ